MATGHMLAMQDSAIVNDPKEAQAIADVFKEVDSGKALKPPRSDFDSVCICSSGPLEHSHWQSWPFSSYSTHWSAGGCCASPSGGRC